MLLAFSVQAQAASIKNVQTGEVTFSATTQNVTITSVDLTKSILIFNERNNLPSPQESCVRGQLTSATNLRLAKSSSTGSVTVRWYVAEFDSGVSVQRGTNVLGSTTVNVPISNVSLTQSFVLVSKDKPNTGFSNDDFGRARLTSATNLELATNGGSGGNADWQVVTFTGSSVQRNLLSMSSGTATSTATITSVDLSRSILLFSYYAANGTAANIGQKMLRGRFSSATQLEFTRDNTGATISIAWEVIQLPVGNTVQSAISSMSGTTTLNDVTVSSVDLAQSIAFSANQSMEGQGWGRTSYSANDNPGISSFTHQLLNSTTLRLQRGTSSSGTTSSVSYFVVDFARANSAPVLAAIGPRNVNENANLNFNATATDADGTTPTFSAANLPSGASFVNNGNGTGTFNWTPSFSQSGVYNVTFIASDGALADSEVVAITVNNVNRAPVLAAIGPKSVNESVLLTFNDSASDPDGTTPTMSAAGVPAGASFVNNGNGTGTFAWTPNFTQSGVFNVTFIASDGALADSEVVAITVNNVNQAPVLAAIGPKSVNEGVLLTFSDSTTDADGTIPTMSAVSVPAGASFVNNGNGTGTFTWTPGFSQSGVFNVTFIASDGALADSEVVAITVNNVNQPPALAAIGPKSVNEGVLLTFNDSATDGDGTIPAMSAVGVPTGASFVNNGNGTGTFTWTPNFTQSGAFNVTFIASDGTLADSEVVVITVNNVNQAPVLAAIGPKSVDEGVLLTFNDSATDADGTIPTMSAVGVPAGASFINNANGTGTFTWTPNFTQSGVFSVTFIASDGSLADSEVVSVTVTNINQAPMLAAIGPKSVNEGVQLSFNSSGSDVDGSTPAMAAANIPAGANFIDNADGTGTFTWTPNFAQSGVFNVTFIASDGALADSEVVAITVNDINQAPVLASIGPRSADEGVLLNFNTSATDADGAIPSMTAVNLPLGANYVDNGNGTGTFNWTPSFTQSGVYNVTFIASDGSLADSEVVAMNVNNVNQAPVLAAIGAQNVNEGVLLTFSPSATDPDATTPSMTAVGLPSGASYLDNGNGTGTFNWTPSFAQSGVVNVTFIASDGTLADSEVVAITVDDVNQAPTLAAIGPKSVPENANLNFNVSASDVDGTTPTFVAEDSPINATFTDNGNGTGTFDFNPDFTQSGVYNVRFIASDGALADTELVAITVNNVSLPPVLAAIGPKSVDENANLNFGVSASDPDLTTPTLSAVGVPLTATFTDNGNGTGTFDFTPSFAQAGVYNVTFIASDGAIADSEVVAITVNNVNRAPLLAAIGPKNVEEGVLLSFNDSATDPDGAIPSMSAANLPVGATFVDNANGTGTFDFTPDFTQAGVFNITFIASDGSLADSEVVAITVNNVNRVPVLAAIGPKSVAENANLNFATSATDPDLTTPVLTATGLPAGAAYTDNGNGTATFDFTPNFTQSGVFNVTFIASDGALADSEVVAITVTNTNRTPVLAAIGAQIVTEGANLNFGISSSDPDGATPTLSALSIPLNATLTDNGDGAGTFNFDPTFVQAGVYNVTFIASDGTLADSEVVAITVNEAGNQRPVLAAIGTKSVNEDANLSFGTSAADVDGAIPVMTAVGVPVNATYTNNGDGTGSFSFDPDFTQSGVYNVTFIASDGSLADSETVAITVNNVNLAPVLAAIGPQAVAEGANLAFGVSATDADAQVPVLTALNVPTNASFTDNGNGAGSFVFDPDFTQSGVFNVTFIASDGVLADSEVVAVTVSDVNRAPVLAAIGPQNLDEGANLSFVVSATDLDGATPTLTTVNLPLNAGFTDNGNGTGSFSFDPDFTQSGIYNVTIIASDGSLADSEVVAITVNNVNQAPALASIGPRSVSEGDNLNFNISATDFDANIPTLSAQNVPANATFTDNGNGTGTFDFNPDFTQSGVYNILFIASDGTLADSETVAVTVTEFNRPPVLAA
ncbi:MAG: tandem-95 repeat protein, partial [Candidatus Zixiibacteriota bacterium]